jgi:hypothetical protein
MSIGFVLTSPSHWLQISKYSAWGLAAGTLQMGSRLALESRYLYLYKNDVSKKALLYSRTSMIRLGLPTEASYAADQLWFIKSEIKAAAWYGLNLHLDTSICSLRW